MMHQKEIQIVRFSMVVLFSSLMVVYLLLYQIKGDDIVNQLSVIKQENAYSGGAISDMLYADTGTEDDMRSNDESSLLIEDSVQTTGVTELPKKSLSLFESGSGSASGTIEKTSKITVLSGTSLRYGRVDSVEKLGISYQYALKDQKDIYYVYLEPKKYNFDEIVRSLGGTTHTITTEKEMVENKLFGEKVTFINLPEYKEKKVIMLFELNKQLWLVQVNYPIYHTSKGYLKKIFIE